MGHDTPAHLKTTNSRLIEHLKNTLPKRRKTKHSVQMNNRYVPIPYVHIESVNT